MNKQGLVWGLEASLLGWRLVVGFGEHSNEP
jgi:hypothetical protein